MDEQNLSGEGEPRRVRSSRRRGYGRSGRGRKLNLRTLVNSSWFDRAIHITVGVAAFGYLALMVDRFHEDEISLGFRFLGSPKPEMLYGFGRPASVGNGANDWTKVTDSTPIDNYGFWRYRGDGGGTYVIRFGPDGGADEISCFHQSGDRGACPGLFWINMGDGEDRIAYQLGRAPQRILNGPSAILRYPGIGVDFELQQYRVRRFTVRSPKSPVPARIPRFVRFLIP